MTEPAQSKEPIAEEFTIGSGAFLHSLLSRVGIAHSDKEGIRLRIIITLLLTFVPLLLLSAMQGLAVGHSVHVPFLFDISELVRYLLVVPLLISCETFIDPWLKKVVQYLREHLVDAQDQERFSAIVQHHLRLRNSDFLEFSLLILVFFWQWVDVSTHAPVVSTWHLLPGGNEPSYAFNYYIYLAKPLVRFIWLRWLLRYLVWSLFLIRLQKLPLKLLPTHPDRHGGLLFVSTGHTKFAVLAFAFANQAAGILAEQIIFEGKTLYSFRYVIMGITFIMAIIILSPLVAFTSKLMDAKRHGLFDYGALANKHAALFKEKWIDNFDQNKDSLLGAADVSSLADMNGSYDVVKDMSVCLISKDNVIALLIAVLLPFTPLLLTVYPFDELLKHFIKAIM
jgi:hypothetical protein